MAGCSVDGSCDPLFPCSLSLRIPLPSARLASVALSALQVDAELSPLVRRQLAVVAAAASSPCPQSCLLQVHYQATTNRILRVAVNSFIDSLQLVIQLMQELDVDASPASEPPRPPAGPDIRCLS